MKKIYTGIVIVLLVLVGVWQFNRPHLDNSKQPITIGAVISLTGPAAQFGEFAQKGMELAVNEINKKGGADGRLVKVIYEDDQTDPGRAVLAFNKLTGLDGAQAIVGGLWDFVAQPIFPLALNNKITFITPTNFRIEGDFELNDQSFSMLTDFDQVIRELKSVLIKDDVKKVAVVHFKSVFGTEIAKTISQIVTEANKGEVIDEAYNSINTNDFKTTILKLKTQKVDTVFLDMVDKDTFNFLQRAKELSFTPKIITYVGAYDALDKSNQSLLEGVTILNWDVSSKEFTKKFEAEYGISPAKGANRAYDSVYILVEAISKTNSTADVASYISSHDFSTVNGKIHFLSTHQVGSIPVEIDTFTKGELILVKD